MTTTQLIIILFAIGFSFLSWLVGKIREQAEINRVQRERTRRREEELRTGRPQPEQPQSGVRLPAELQSLAERRQQQLRALREQQMQRMRGQQPAQRPPQAGPAPARAGTTSETSWQEQQTQSAGRQHEMRTPTPLRPTTLKSSHPQTPHQSRTAGRESMSTPTPMRGQKPLPPVKKPPATQRPAPSQRPSSSQRMSPPAPRRPQARPLQISPRPEAPQRSMSPYEQAVHEQRAQDKLDKSAAAAAIAGSLAFELRNMTREDWRRAIVLREILNPPITERGEDAQPGSAH